MNERDKSIFALLRRIEEIRQSSRFVIFKKIGTFRISFSIYSENYRALTKTLNRYYSIPQILSENTIRRRRIQRTVVKDIHNLIFSAKSYRDHIYEMNKPQVFRQKINAEFDQNSSFHFIRALRNFLIHREPLYLVSRKEHTRLETGQLEILQYESMDKTPFNNYLIERTSNSNSNSTHDRMAMQYLQQLPDKINLNTVIQEFNELLCYFHNWFILKYVSENESDLQDLSSETKTLHQKAILNGLTQDHPMTKGQLKNLNMLLRKVALEKNDA